MSTLEHPEGDEPAERPDEAPEEKPAEPPADTDVAEGEAEESGSTLERADDDPLEADEITVDPTRVRKAPRFGRFAVIGGLVGLLVALFQTRVATPESIAEASGPWASNAWGFFWLMAAIFVPIGVLVMCGVALLADRRSRRVK
ncbi:hypothetical protein [Pseudactinotalea sp.]|uniref:hypothetical protein n=1 Tax=Pseudactinotalea sp. TaxID=1926260 RepID=UPI003B3B38BF